MLERDDAPWELTLPAPAGGYSLWNGENPTVDSVPPVGLDSKSDRLAPNGTTGERPCLARCMGKRIMAVTLSRHHLTGLMHGMGDPEVFGLEYFGNGRYCLSRTVLVGDKLAQRPIYGPRDLLEAFAKHTANCQPDPHLTRPVIRATCQFPSPNRWYTPKDGNRMLETAIGFMDEAFGEGAVFAGWMHAYGSAHAELYITPLTMEGDRQKVNMCDDRPDIPDDLVERWQGRVLDRHPVRPPRTDWERKFPAACESDIQRTLSGFQG